MHAYLRTESCAMMRIAAQISANYGLIITGGTVQAVVNGYASYRPSETKRQNIVNININQTMTGGTGYTVTDSKGNEILSYKTSKSFYHPIYLLH